MKTKILRILLLLLFTVASLDCRASYDACIDGIFYSFNGDKAKVVTRDPETGSYKGEVVIPESVEYEGVTYHVTAIDNEAFSGCSQLTSVQIPSSITSIGYGAFNSCTTLSAIVIPSSVTSIGSEAFNNCRALTDVTLPSNLTLISYKMFRNCSALRHIDIPATVRCIRENAFSGCHKLESIAIPDGIKEIESYTFENCKALTSVSIPSSVTTIGSSAFVGCASLSAIDFHEGVTSIGSNSFNGCSGMLTLHIPASLTTIGKSAFLSCSSLTSITVAEGNTVYDSRNDCNALIYTATDSLINGGANTVIPSSVRVIGSGAFRGCKSLKNIDIPEGVSIIMGMAFYQCIGLTSFHLPASVTRISNNAIQGCTQIKTITVAEDNTVYDSREGCNGIVESATHIFVIGCTQSVIPSSVMTIGACAFMGMPLKSMMIPSGVTRIGNEAFRDCTQLVNVGFPATLKEIGAWAFSGCKSIKYVTLREGLTNISVSAFELCENLTEVDIPGTVTSIGAAAFSDCPSLTLVKSHIKTPFAINAFDSWNTKAKCTLQVPYDTRLSYLRTNGWKDFMSIVEAIATTYYTLTLDAGAHGSLSYEGTTVNNGTTDIQVLERKTVKITITPDEGYQLSDLTENAVYVTSKVKDGVYTISSFKADTKIHATFEKKPVTYCTLTLKASEYGSLTYEGTSITGGSKNFSVPQGHPVSVCIIPDRECELQSLKANGASITTVGASGGTYTINNLSKDMVVQAEFKKKTTTLDIDGLTYTATLADHCATLTNGIFSGHYRVPAMVSVAGEECAVTALGASLFAGCGDLLSVAVPSSVRSAGQGLFAGCSRLAAIVWDADMALTDDIMGPQSNPNLLVYVNQQSHAPTGVHNVIVNGKAAHITLSDAGSGNNFYAPKSFTAQQIDYSHNYSMTTGINECRGWETLALPFDVTLVAHAGKGELRPITIWEETPGTKPFFLYQYGASGFTPASSIHANTPYLISMPNHSSYQQEYCVNGKVTFSATNTQILASDQLTCPSRGEKTFTPCFIETTSDDHLYALNVSNDLGSHAGAYTEGSVFVRTPQRAVHPFEACMLTTTAGAAVISIFDEVATTIPSLLRENASDNRGGILYNLAGQAVRDTRGMTTDEILRGLPKGIYVIGGKKNKK